MCSLHRMVRRRSFRAPTPPGWAEAPPGADVKTYDFDVDTGSLRFLPGVSGEILASDTNGSDIVFLRRKSAARRHELDLWSTGPGRWEYHRGRRSCRGLRSLVRVVEHVPEVRMSSRWCRPRVSMTAVAFVERRSTAVAGNRSTATMSRRIRSAVFPVDPAGSRRAETRRCRRCAPAKIRCTSAEEGRGRPVDRSAWDLCRWGTDFL